VYQPVARRENPRATNMADLDEYGKLHCKESACFCCALRPRDLLLSLLSPGQPSFSTNCSPVFVVVKTRASTEAPGCNMAPIDHEEL
jgi:hypothetical protein